MNQKFSDLIKGKPQGAELLAAMKITDSTKATPDVLDSVQAALHEMDNGKSPQEAADLILKSAQLAKYGSEGNITAPALSPEFAAIGESIEGPLNERGKQIYTEAIESAGAYAEGAEGEIKNYVEQTVRSGIFQGASEAAQNPEIQKKFLAAIQSGKSQPKSGKNSP